MGKRKKNEGKWSQTMVIEVNCIKIKQNYGKWSKITGNEAKQGEMK